MSDTRAIRILKNLDALGCTLIANRAKTGEYISTYVWRVRNGGGSPIVPFESTMAVTSNGGRGTCVRAGGG